MKISFLLIGLFFSACAWGQLDKDLKEFIHHKDLSGFDNYVKQLQAHDSTTHITEIYSREIVPGFTERVFVFEHATINGSNQNVATVETFKARLLCAPGVIFYGKLSRQAFKLIGDDWKPSDEIVYQENDKSYSDALRKKFRNTFKVSLNDQELFKDSIAYGSDCAYKASTRMRSQFQKFVYAKDTKSLKQWLTSANTETQLYAYEGLETLQRSGVALSEEIKKMMMAVAQKKGGVRFCSGASISTVEISQVIKELHPE